MTLSTPTEIGEWLIQHPVPARLTFQVKLVHIRLVPGALEALVELFEAAS